MNYSSDFPELFDLDSIVKCYAQKYPGFRERNRQGITDPYIFFYGTLCMADKYKYCTRPRCKTEIVCVAHNIRSFFLSLPLISRRNLLFIAPNYLAHIPFKRGELCTILLFEGNPDRWI